MNYPAAAPPVPVSHVPRWVWAGLVLLHLVALGWQLRRQQPYFPDSGRYVQAAHNLRTHGTLYAESLAGPALRPQEFTIRPPAYPLLLLLTGADTAGRQPLIMLLLQNGLSLLNLTLALRWLASSRLSPRQWGLVLLLAATAPAQIIYANVLMSELLLQTAVVVLWRALLAFGQPARPTRAFAVAALATAAALLSKPVFFPAAAFLLVLGLVTGWRRQRPALAVWGAVPVLVALLWMSRNEARTGYFHFSSITEINLLRYNVRGVLQAAEGPAAAENFVRSTLAESERLPAFRDQQHYVQRAGMTVLWRYPLAYAGQHLRGMLTFFLDPGRFDLVYFLGLQDAAGPGLLHHLNQRGSPALWEYLRHLPLGLLAGLLLILAANLLRLVLVLRFLASRSYSRVSRLLLLALVGYVAFLTGPLGASRFVVPVLPLLLAAAGAGLTAGPAFRSAVGAAWQSLRPATGTGDDG
ncbi:hypothetical protein HNQ93_003544 [Hymenobacter luteus]|uniref:Glycosyltransferase RgtA/B/C/D-like domain-containing protein n=2 Tax=Hymenobacter TaxID=89966 RepID=A0A7W9T385_9BACT|nr:MULTISPECIES: hypothetical protein [Hymenobacter]MBB4602779.1 hypothetical protein [Hymenobacter latericoloratus]MBB6060670.1 hypothetical protein [Hymenobacter luteus]